MQFHLKGNNKSKSVFVSSQLLQEMCTKSKNVVSLPLFFHKNDMV